MFGLTGANNRNQDQFQNYKADVENHELEKGSHSL